MKTPPLQRLVLSLYPTQSSRFWSECSNAVAIIASRDPGVAEPLRRLTEDGFMPTVLVERVTGRVRLPRLMRDKVRAHGFAIDVALIRRRCTAAIVLEKSHFTTWLEAAVADRIYGIESPEGTPHKAFIETQDVELFFCSEHNAASYAAREAARIVHYDRTALLGALAGCEERESLAAIDLLPGDALITFDPLGLRDEVLDTRAATFAS